MQSKFTFGLLVVALLVAQAPLVHNAKILAAFSFPGKSHFMMINALVAELMKHGHEMTVITAYSLNPEKLGSNYTEILIEPVYDFWDELQSIFATNNLFELTNLHIRDFLKMVEVLGVSTTEHALKQPKVQQIINAKQTEGVYDLLLVEQFYQEAFLTLSKIYKIPIVSLCTLGSLNYMSQMVGMILPWSYVPHHFMPFTDRMTFVERVENTIYSFMEDMHREFVYFPKQDALVEKYFGHLDLPMSKVRDMEREQSVILLNSHTPLTSTRPTIDSIVNVGGMHIYPPKPLPSDLQKFLDGAEHGVIYFSLGSNVQSKDMPADKIQMFLEVFSSMKQRIIWKFENESVSHLPPNVLVKKWLPQADILAHRNVKVFITHGGLFGTQEGVHYGVPMLGIPIYCDQRLNIKKAVLGGYAISLHFQSITHDILKQALLDLIEQPHYRKNVQRMSAVFRDRPMSARESAIYWIEYVVRHKGAPHLRSAGVDLPWYQFYLLDVLAAFLLVVLLAVTVIVLAWRWVLRRIKSQPRKKQQSGKKKKKN